MATKPNSLRDIRIARQDQEKSWRWYRTSVQRMNKTGTQFRNDITKESVFVNTVNVGKMYLFRYDPKHKETLPVYDTYPLVFPFNRAPGGFLGINLHYLPYGYRFLLIEKMGPHLTGQTNENRRAKLSWSILNSLASIDMLSVSVKHYLTSHVQSRFMQIGFDDWKTAAALPIDNFIRK
jgi:hypothetical protein